MTEPEARKLVEPYINISADYEGFPDIETITAYDAITPPDVVQREK